MTFGNGPWRVYRRVADRAGVALVVTLIVLAVLALIIAGAVRAAMTSLRASGLDYREARAFYAAEAGAEAALSQLNVALQDGVLEDGELLNIMPPQLEGFDFSDFRVQKRGGVIIEDITDGSYQGLYALTQKVDIQSMADDAIGTRAGVVLRAKAQAIPLFQFAVFFEGGFVDAAGSRKDMIGRVHSNLGLFLSGCDLHFHRTLTTPGGIYRDGFVSHVPIGGGPGNPCGINVWIRNGSGQDHKLTFDSADTPDPERFRFLSEKRFDSKLRTGAHGTERLELPLPQGLTPLELIRPRESGDGAIEQTTKFAWKADMYVTVDLARHVDPIVACGPVPPPGLPALIPEITVVRYDGGTPLPDAMKCHIFQFHWESFFDNAEEGWIDVLDVDIGQLGVWDATYPVAYLPEIIYVEFVNGSVSDPAVTDPHGNGSFANRYFPVLRVKNGTALPGPLTLGSEYPLFVWGDYNTIEWKPSALFGDRLSALSNAWDDSHPANQSDNENSGNPDADDTSQYFAVVTGVGEGNIGCFHEDPACSGVVPHGPGGWVKMLEDWNSCPGGPEGGRCVHTMIGSFISLYAPQRASPWGKFPGDNYYRRPVRNWSFDTRFEDPENLPPGTPVVGQVFRAAFRESY